MKIMLKGKIGQILRKNNLYLAELDVYQNRGGGADNILGTLNVLVSRDVAMTLMTRADEVHDLKTRITVELDDGA
jgi:hypothetical protein